MRQELAEFQGLDTSELPLHRALKIEITAADLRQNDVAALAKISETQLSHKLRGRKPISAAEAIRIREAISELKTAKAVPA
jgi:transcriptional regulator with XRE-family HTH domain